MAQAAVGAYLGQPLDVQRNFPTEVTLDEYLLVHGEPVDHLSQAAELLVSQRPDPRIRADVGHLQEPLRGRSSDPVDVGQGDDHALVVGDVDPCQTSHGLALPLLVLGIRAEHPDGALSLDHLALRTDLLDRRTNLHLLSISLILPRDRSLSESSTLTRSPATKRTK